MPSGAVDLRDNHRRSGRKADKQVDYDIDQHAGCAADRTERLLADESADDHCICGVIKLLKKGAK